MNCTITFLAQSGWLIETSEELWLFDYWRGELPEVVRTSYKPLLVFVSHRHGDHFNKKVFALAQRPGATNFILSADVPHPPDGALLLSEGDNAQLGVLRLVAYGSTDAGISFLVKHPEFSLFHAGDYNLWHWPLESTPDEIAEAEAGFYRILEHLAEEQIDLAFFPVDSRQKEDYDRGARDFALRLKPRYFFPMHFGEDWLAPQPFVAWADSALPEMKVFAPSPTNLHFVISTE